MRVLVISQLYPPDMGGGSTRAHNVVKGLARLGHTVAVVAAFPHYPDGVIPNQYRGRIRCIVPTNLAKVIRTWVPSIQSKGLVRRLFLYLAFCVSSMTAFPLVRRPDVIWAANPNVFSIFPAFLMGRLTGTPVVGNVDDLWPDELYDLDMMKSSVLRHIAESVCRFAYTAPVALTPISQGYVDALNSKYNGHRRHDSYHVVPAGVDLDVFTPNGRPMVPKPDDAFTVVYIGAFSRAYDFDQVLRAARLLTPKAGIRIVLQGRGELLAGLEAKVKASGLPNVAIIPRIVSKGEVAGILFAADALLLPLGGTAAIEMGISSKLYEYQASGKPIVCCSRGESAAYVHRTGSGIVVPPGDHHGLAEAILWLHGDRDAALSLGRAGRQWVEGHLSCETIGRLMEGVFQKTVPRPDP